MERYNYDRVLGMIEHKEGDFIKYDEFIHSNRNKLSPMTTLISILEREGINILDDKIMEIYKGCLKQCKRSINEMAQREVYKSENNG